MGGGRVVVNAKAITASGFVGAPDARGAVSRRVAVPEADALHADTEQVLCGARSAR